MVIGMRVPRSSRYSVVTPFRTSVVTPPPLLPPTKPLTFPNTIPPALLPGAGVRATTTGAMAVRVYAPAVRLLIE